MEVDIRTFVSLAALLGLIFSVGFTVIGLSVYRIYDMGRQWLHLVNPDGQAGRSHRVRIKEVGEVTFGKGRKARTYIPDGRGKLGSGRHGGYVVNAKTGWTYGLPTGEESLNWLARTYDENGEEVTGRGGKPKADPKIKRALRLLLPMNPLAYAHAIRHNESEDVLLANEPEKGAWIGGAMPWIFGIALILMIVLGAGLFIFSKGSGS